MSSYLIHSGKSDQKQFRVLFDWLDFIHRCFSHSRWSCQNQAVIPALIYTFHFIPLRSMINVCSVLALFIPNTLLSFLVTELESNHRLTLFHHHNSDWLSLQLIRQDNRLHRWKASVADIHPFHIRISTFPYNSSPFLPTTYCT